MADGGRSEGVRLGLIGFDDGLPFELVAATGTLGLETGPPAGASLLLVDAREIAAHTLSDALLTELHRRKGGGGRVRVAPRERSRVRGSVR